MEVKVSFWNRDYACHKSWNPDLILQQALIEF
jgi:hypothetical protein